MLSPPKRAPVAASEEDSSEEGKLDSAPEVEDTTQPAQAIRPPAKQCRGESATPAFGAVSQVRSGFEDRRAGGALVQRMGPPYHLGDPLGGGDRGRNSSLNIGWHMALAVLYLPLLGVLSSLQPHLASLLPFMHLSHLGGYR